MMLKKGNNLEIFEGVAIKGYQDRISHLQFKWQSERGKMWNKIVRAKYVYNVDDEIQSLSCKKKCSNM